MGRARLVHLGWLAAALAVLVACSPGSGTVRGVVIDVEGTLQEVTAFTVLVEGEKLRFLPVDDADYPFPLQHLQEHVRTGEPVLVEWELRSGERFAVSIEDG